MNTYELIKNVSIGNIEMDGKTLQAYDCETVKKEVSCELTNVNDAMAFLKDVEKFHIISMYGYAMNDLMKKSEAYERAVNTNDADVEYSKADYDKMWSSVCVAMATHDAWKTIVSDRNYSVSDINNIPNIVRLFAFWSLGTKGIVFGKDAKYMNMLNSVMACDLEKGGDKANTKKAILAWASPRFQTRNASANYLMDGNLNNIDEKTLKACITSASVKAVHDKKGLRFKDANQTQVLKAIIGAIFVERFGSATKSDTNKDTKAFVTTVI